MEAAIADVYLRLSCLFQVSDSLGSAAKIEMPRYWHH